MQVVPDEEWAYPVDPNGYDLGGALVWAGFNLSEPLEEQGTVEKEVVDNLFTELVICGYMHSKFQSSRMLVDLDQNGKRYRVELGLDELLYIIENGQIENDGRVKGEFVFVITRVSDGKMVLMQVGSRQYESWKNWKSNKEGSNDECLLKY